MADKHQDEDAAGHPDRETRNLYERIAFIALDDSESDFEIILKHIYTPIEKIIGECGKNEKNLAPVEEPGSKKAVLVGNGSESLLKIPHG
jgi:hypothetical protein